MLTDRQSEILALLAAGMTQQDVAARLYISRHTVKGHLAVIFDHLGVRTAAGAVGRALREGLIA